jgi:uncharacterized protein YecT (DUF1311 family)
MMNVRFSLGMGAALFAAAAICATPSLAAIPGQPNAADVKAVDACLADAAKAKGDPDACIGRVTNECLANTQTPAAMHECNNRELLVWDAALNRDYTQLTAFLTDDSKKQALREAQREFFVGKLKTCTFERLAHRDSAGGLAAAARCEVKATARQDLWLVDQINSFKAP